MPSLESSVEARLLGQMVMDVTINLLLSLYMRFCLLSSIDLVPVKLIFCKATGLKVTCGGAK